MKKLLLSAALLLSVATAKADFTVTYGPTLWSACSDVPAGLPTSHLANSATCSNISAHSASREITVSADGNITVTFQYTAGNHMLCMLGCDVVNGEGTVVASDYHGGFTGGNSSNNAYTLSNVPAGNYTIRYFVCNSSTAPKHELSQSNGNITHVGNVTERSRTEAINGASFWTTATVYPAGLPAVADAKCKKENVVTVPAGGGNVTVSFLYSSGSHGLKVLGVDLVGPSGTVVASDYRTLQAGGNKVPQVYTLSSVPGGTYLMRWYILNNAKDNNPANFNGSATITSAPLASDDAVSTFFSSIKSVAAAKHAANGDKAGKAGYYTVASYDALTTAKELTEATVANIGSIAEAIEHVEVALPTAGKFYRILNSAGNAYLVSGTGTGQAQFEGSAGDLKKSVFYYDGSYLLSYEHGTYIAAAVFTGVSASKMLAYTDALGTSAATGIVFSTSPTFGMLNVRYEGGNRYLYSMAAGNANGGSSDGGAGYRFIVEEVTSLPVDMTAGWATLYAPVQLACGSEVEAYTVAPVEAGAAFATLNKVEGSIPAATGVILKAADGVTGLVNLTIEEGTASATSALQGTYAAENIAADAYVLSNGTNGIGLYVAEKNQTGSTWKNNGFKAYLPAPVAGAPMLTFDFGTETAIENITAAKQNGAIYDLSGRRVKAAQKGIFIINGKKVIK